MSVPNHCQVPNHCKNPKSLLKNIVKRYDDSTFLNYFLFSNFENKTLETATTDLET